MSVELSAFLRSWSWEPTIVVGLGLAAALYVIGWARMRQRARGRTRIAPWRAWCFAAGLTAIGLALLSPIAAFSGLFFFMHMSQHVLLVMVAAPLLSLGAPMFPWLWALPRGLRLGLARLLRPRHPIRRALDALTRPGVATVLHLGTVALWHVPAYYDAAQGRTVTHDLQHLMFLGTALLFWWPVAPSVGPPRLGHGFAILYFIPPMLVGKFIGALITFAEEPLYATYRAVPRVWGLSALEDQQLAGLTMWVGGAFFMFVAMTISFFLWSGRDDAEEARRPLRIGVEPPVRATGSE